MSLLRYCGGKSKQAPDIVPHITVPKGGTFCEPFVGGGSVALEVARRNPYIRIILNDKDPEVAVFWKIIAGDDEDAFEELKDLVRLAEVSDEYFDHFLADPDLDPVWRAFRFFYLNHTAHVTSLNKRKLGDIDSRWNAYRHLKDMDEAREVLKGRTLVYCKDYSEFIEQADKSWTFYLDPPYVQQGNKLYTEFQFTEADHTKLRDLLKATSASWVLSYDMHPLVAELYEEFTIHTREVQYDMSTAGGKSKKRKGVEAIILPQRRKS